MVFMIYFLWWISYSEDCWWSIKQGLEGWKSCFLQYNSQQHWSCQGTPLLYINFFNTWLNLDGLNFRLNCTFGLPGIAIARFWNLRILHNRDTRKIKSAIKPKFYFKAFVVSHHWMLNLSGCRKSSSITER